MNTNLSIWVVESLVISAEAFIGSSYGNMIGCDAKSLQTLLDVNSNGATSSPQPNNERWPKTRVKNLNAKPKAIFHNVLFGQKLLVSHTRLTLGCCCIAMENTSSVTEKLYLDAQTLLEASWQLGAMVADSGFQPTFIIAIWRGGAPIGVAVQEMLKARGIVADHIAIRTASYQGIDGRDDEVQVFSMSYVIKNINYDDSVLIVDDVFDTGRSIEAVIDHLRKKARLNMPQDIRIAVPYYKPSRNLSGRAPDYFLHETEQWLKFPHSLEGLGVDEIKIHRPALAGILAEADKVFV